MWCTGTAGMPSPWTATPGNRPAGPCGISPKAEVFAVDAAGSPSGVT